MITREMFDARIAALPEVLPNGVGMTARINALQDLVVDLRRELIEARGEPPDSAAALVVGARHGKADRMRAVNYLHALAAAVIEDRAAITISITSDGDFEDRPRSWHDEPLAPSYEWRKYGERWLIEGTVKR